MYRAKRARMGKRMEPSKKNVSECWNEISDEGDGSQVPIGQLIPYNISAPVFGDGPNRRERQTFFLKGFRICREFYYNRNSSATNSRPIEIHYAIIQWKCPIDNDDVVAPVNKLAKNFFRYNNGNIDKSRDFGRPIAGQEHLAYTLAGDPWEMYLNCLKMNRNNGYRVLTHRRKVLNCVTSIAEAENRCVWKIDKYYRVNKWMETEDRDSIRYKNPMYEVYWCNYQTPYDFPSDPTAITDYIRTNKFHVHYYTENRK